MNISQLTQVKKLLEQKGGVLNLINEANEQTGGGIESFRQIFETFQLFKTEGLKYGQEIKDLTEYLLNNIKKILANPLKETQLIDSKIIDILCNFLRKLLGDTRTNEEIINELMDKDKIIINLSRISIAITTEILNLAKSVIDPLVSSINTIQNGGGMDGGFVIETTLAIVIIVIVIVAAIVLITAIIAGTIILIQYSPLIVNVVDGMLISFNNLISNLIILKLSQKPDTKDLAKQYIKNYDSYQALGELKQISDSTLDATKTLGKQNIDAVSKLGETSLGTTTTVGKASLGATTKTLVGGNSVVEKIINEYEEALIDTDKLIRFIVDKCDEFDKLRYENKLLDKILSIGPGYKLVLYIMKSMVPLIYLVLETQQTMITTLFRERQIIEPPKTLYQKLTLITNIPQQTWNYLLNEFPTSFISIFTLSQNAIQKLDTNPTPDPTTIANVLKKNPRILQDILNIIRSTKITISFDGQQGGYKEKYKHIKKEYLRLKHDEQL